MKRSSQTTQPDDPVTLLRMFERNEITLEEYVIRGGPNLYSTGGWPLGFSPKYYERRELEKKFQDYADTVRAYTTVDSEAQRNSAILHQHDNVLQRILKEEIPSVIGKLKAKHETESVETVMRNIDVDALRYKFNNATHLRNASASIVRHCQERSAKLRAQATELHKKLVVATVLDATDTVLMKNMETLKRVSRAEERKEKQRERVETEHEGVMNYYAGRDAEMMAMTDQDSSQIDDAFRNAIAQALMSPAQRVAAPMTATKPLAVTAPSII